MMYPFMTLNDETEITHSDVKYADDKEIVKVYIETPDEKDGFHNATCYLPEYKWENIDGYTEAEMDYFKELIQSVAHVIIRLAREGGFKDAANF